MFHIAIIGRPNVGKSTLFNKLVGKNYAITDDIAGVTRDRKEAVARIGSLEFVAIDTAGLEYLISQSSLEKRMVEQTEFAIADADLCFFVVDGKVGVNNTDIYFANYLRKLGKKTILLVNKCENFNEEVLDKEYYKLGFGKPIAISAEHKLGFGEIYEAISPIILEYQKTFQDIVINEEDRNEINDIDEDIAFKNHHLQIAVIGRPNAGKSTFLNRVLGQERFITGAEAGITRDAVATDFSFKDYKIRFIDTAGIRKKTNIINKLEKLSTTDSYRAIRFAQLVILLIDANSLLDHQDVALAGQVLKEGRALIFAINKIDEVKGDKEVFMRQVRKQIEGLFAEISGAPIMAVSAKTGYNVEKTLNLALQTYEQWQTHIATNKINEWLKHAYSEHSPNLYKGKVIKLKYATQIKKRPPTFAVFANYIKPLEGSYKRYLVNSLRSYFNLNLTPIRLLLRKSDNPYQNKKEKLFSKKTHQSKK